MATTSNFGWETPDDTDYVKDGAAAMRTLGNSIDTSMGDLKGGTTGQVLSKNTNTDMDFVWVTPDDADAIQNSIVDAKGDLIAATAADTPARLAVGTNGQVLAANSSTATGLEWQTISSGGMTELASGTLSGSAVNVTGLSTAYQQLVIRVSGIDLSTAQYFYVRFNNDTGSNYTFTGTENNYGAFSTIDADYVRFLFSQWIHASGNAATLWLTIDNYATTATTYRPFQGVWGAYANSSNDRRAGHFGGIYTAVGSAITQVNFSVTSGTFEAGSYKIFGVK